MRDIRASVEVGALIGAGKLHELHRGALAEYECWQCGTPGRTTEPTSVIVLAYRVFRVVRLAHASCAAFQEILDAVAAGRLAFPVDRVYDGLEQVPQAHDDMEHDRATGKLVVRVRH